MSGTGYYLGEYVPPSNREAGIAWLKGLGSDVERVFEYLDIVRCLPSLIRLHTMAGLLLLLLCDSYRGL